MVFEILVDRCTFKRCTFRGSLQPITVTEWLEDSGTKKSSPVSGGIGQDFYLASQTSINQPPDCGYCGIHYVSIVSLEDGNNITVVARQERLPHG